MPHDSPTTAEDLGKTQTGSSPMEASNAGGQVYHTEHPP